MILKDYTPELFITNFLEDRHNLGEDAQYIYEEIFSAIMGKDISLDSFIEEIDYALEEDKINFLEEVEYKVGDQLTEEDMEELDYLISEGLFDGIKEKFNSIFNPAGLEFNPIFGNITRKSWKRAAEVMNPEARKAALAKAAAESGGFFSKLKNKFTTFFGGLKGKSFGEILKQGLSWFKNPENMAKAIGTTGGVALLIFMLRALKKRKKNKEYEELRKAASNDDLYEDIDYRVESYNEILEECRTNKELNKALFGENHIRKDYYFGY